MAGRYPEDDRFIYYANDSTLATHLARAVSHREGCKCIPSWKSSDNLQLDI